MTDLFADGGTTPDENKDYVAELVGPGKKFKSVNDLAKSKVFTDTHVQRVEQSNDELRADYLALLEKDKTRASLEELLDQQRQLANREHTPSKEVEKPIDPKLIEDIFDRRFKEVETSKSKAQNAQSVMEKLKERHGHNYQNFLNEKTQELGLTKEMVQTLAETTPKVLMRTFGLDEAPLTDPFQAPPRSSVFSPSSGTKERTWSHYQDLKKTDPKSYYDPKTIVQMEKDYMRLGARFEDGDFKRYGDTSFPN
jgi:hypothetical protein